MLLWLITQRTNSAWFPKLGVKKLRLWTYGGMVPLGWCWRGPGRCRARVPNGGNRAIPRGLLWTTVRWCPQAHVAVRAWPPSQYLLQDWADILGSKESMLLLGEGHSRPSQGCRLWEQDLGDTCKGHLHFISSLSEWHTQIMAASLLVSWVHISPFLYTKCYLVVVSRGHGLLFKQGISRRWFSHLANGM